MGNLGIIARTNGSQNHRIFAGSGYVLAVPVDLANKINASNLTTMNLIEQLEPALLAKGLPKQVLDQAITELGNYQDILAEFFKGLPDEWIQYVTEETDKLLKYENWHCAVRQDHETGMSLLLADKNGTGKVLGLLARALEVLTVFLETTDFSNSVSYSDLENLRRWLEEVSILITQMLGEKLALPQKALLKRISSAAKEFMVEMLKSLDFPPTIDQLMAVRALAEFIVGDSQDHVMVIRGYAGTGKTTIISALTKAMMIKGFNFSLLAPTGRAAKVMSQRSGLNAETIHRCIFELDEIVNGQPQFHRRSQDLEQVVFIVDESSMISSVTHQENIRTWGKKPLLEQLINFVFEGGKNRIIFLGDTAQLPPVREQRSLALSPEDLGKVYHLRASKIELTNVVRQGKLSGPLKLATDIRRAITSRSLPRQFILPDSTDISCASRSGAMNALRAAVDEVGIQNVCLITLKNQTARIYNRRIRNDVLGFRDVLVPTDNLMVVQNNYSWRNEEAGCLFLANGEIVKVISAAPEEKLGKFRFSETMLSVSGAHGEVMLTGKVLLDLVDSEEACLSQEAREELMETVQSRYSYSSGIELIQAVRRDPYANALQVKYAYAVTCHKSQGGQWEHVFVELQDWYELFRTRPGEALQWLYTAITRTTNNLTLIGLLPGSRKIDAAAIRDCQMKEGIEERMGI